MIEITDNLLKAHPMKKGESEKEYRKRISNLRKSSKYRKVNIVSFSFGFNVNYDMDIITRLRTVSEKTGESMASYIKRLIREDISRDDF